MTTRGTTILDVIKYTRGIVEPGRRLTNAQLADYFELQIETTRRDVPELTARDQAYIAKLSDAVTVLRTEGPEWTDISRSAYNWLATAGMRIPVGSCPLQYSAEA